MAGFTGMMPGMLVHIPALWCKPGGVKCILGFAFPSACRGVLGLPAHPRASGLSGHPPSS